MGSALGIVMIGCSLRYLYTRRTKSKDDDTSSSHESEVKSDVDISPISPTELRDTQLPYELCGNGRTEMPGTGARIVPDF